MDAAAASSQAVSASETNPLSARPVFREVDPRAQTAPVLARLRDVEMNVRIELGRCRMRVADVLKLADGAVVELDHQAADPVDVYVNDRAVGELQHVGDA